MEDAASLGGRSLSADAVSNASTALLSESGASPGDGCEVADVERHEEEGSEHELRGHSGQEKSESRFSGQLSARATPQDLAEATPKDQRGGTPQEQRGGTPQEQREGTPQEQKGATPQEHRGRTPQEQRGGTPQEQRGATPQEQRGATPQDQRGATPQEQRGATPQEQRGGTPQEQRGGTPQEQRGRTPQEQRGGTPQEQRGATPTDQTISGDDTTGRKSVSPDVKPGDRPSTQNSFTDVNRNIQSQQEKLIQDGVSRKQSPEERLSLSRQSQFEDATSENNEVQDIDVRSTDGASLNTTESQRHTSTGSVTGCCCDQSSEPTKDETDAESPKGEIVATPTVSETAESVASLERGSDSRATNQTEPSLEEVGESSCSTQPKYEELGGQEREVLEQCCQQKVVEEVLNVQSPEGENQLKAEINSLQTRLETLIKDNNEKGMRIVALESNLLEMTAKLVNVEKKCLPLETSPSRREASKSRTCAIL